LDLGEVEDTLSRHSSQTTHTCTVVMESCSDAQYWAREVTKLGHTSKLLAPQHTRAYVQGNKNDFNDAEAILEAASRPRTRIDQSMARPARRIRRSAAGGVSAFRRQAAQVLADADNSVSPRGRELLYSQLEWLHLLDTRIAEIEAQLKACERHDPRANLLSKELQGVGILTATALIAAVGDGQAFRRGRDLAAWIGLVPRQHGTGGKPKLLGLSKRGDTYLRTLLIHGARTVVQHAMGKHDVFSDWIKRLRARRGMNIAIVAVANKNARMAWALLHKQALGQVA
jgi:transposase